MLTQRFPKILFVSMVASALTIILFGGCPVAQQPTTPPEDQAQLEPPPASEPDNGENRPIPPPDIDEDTGQNDSGGTIVGGGGGGGDEGDGGGGGGGGAPFVSVDGPNDNLLVRPGTLVNVEFSIFDAQGALNTIELVLTRDSDADGQPDGTPEFTEQISFTAGGNTYSFDTIKAQGLLQNGFARFLVGLRFATVDGTVDINYAPGSLSIDSQVPTGEWITPNLDLLQSSASWIQIRLSATDNRPVTVKVHLDPDLTPGNGNEWTLIADTQLPAGTSELDQWVYLGGFPSNTYYYYVSISDGIAPSYGFYGEILGAKKKLLITNRLVGDFDLNQLTDSSHGAILQGFQPNDLSGSSMAAVPDLDGDGAKELIVVSRFGKPYDIQHEGVGFGEAYLLYGNPSRLRGIVPLNAVGGPPGNPNSIPGLVFPGIRAPLVSVDTGVTSMWTEGMSDVTVVPDMDGDDLPELIFSFPRVESVSLSNEVPSVQHPELFPDVAGMGALEYDAFNYNTLQWDTSEAQFTRGGIVIVSSHSEILKDRNFLNRKGDRLMDLHEVGQMFTRETGGGMGAPQFVLYVKTAEEDPDVNMADCDGDLDPETEYEDWTVKWDVVFANQGPGGFMNRYTNTPFNVPATSPPLANLRYLPYTTDVLDTILPPNTDPCADDNCVIANTWYTWAESPLCFPCTGINEDLECLLTDNPSWHTDWGMMGGGNQISVWTGFYGWAGAEVMPLRDLIGARLLGQRVDDRFGTAVGSDGTWLYISAPKHTALKGDPYTGDDVPDLDADRVDSGVVYQLRTDSRPYNSPVTLTQLWLERGTRTITDPDNEDEEIEVPLTWPYVDAEAVDRRDYTMPVPHQYVVENIGSLRGRDEYWAGAPGEAEPGDRIVTYTFPPDGFESGCLDFEYTAQGGIQGNSCDVSPIYGNYSVGKAAYYTDRTPQIVGPHPGAEIAFVRGVGDVNDDGVYDFAVGSEKIEDPATGDIVGAIYVVFGRPTGLEGDYLLEQLHLAPSDPNRLNGVMLKGKPNEKLARVFDVAGDFNGDGVDDVIVGNDGADAGGDVDVGEAIVIFGSTTLESPENGWTVDGIVAAGRAIRFMGENAGDLAGANVAGAGDVDRDGYGDILITAPGAEGGKGVTYLIYGSSSLSGDVNLANTGSFSLPGVRFIGRAAGDALGGGTKTVANTDPSGGATTVYSRGVATLGDIDGDGRDDYAISAMLADRNTKQDAGEVYILYGRGD